MWLYISSVEKISYSNSSIYFNESFLNLHNYIKKSDLDNLFYLIDSKISSEIQLAILKRATLMEKKSIDKLVKERRKKAPRGGDKAIPQDQK